MLTKKCLACKKIIYKIPTMSMKTWNTQTKFCSHKCYSTYSVNEKNPRWKGGIYKGTKGYLYIKCRNHPRTDKQGYIPYSVYVMEKHLGRQLSKEEIVHHINHVKGDNRIENLMLFKNESKHATHHTIGNTIRKDHFKNKSNH